MPGMEIAVSTELSSGAISSILEAVPGNATVLRSPVADAIVNLSRAGAGLAPFDPKYAHELIRYAVRRGLIRSDEGDRVAAEIEAVHPTRPEKPAAKAPPVAVHPAAAVRHPFGRRPHVGPIRPAAAASATTHKAPAAARPVAKARPAAKAKPVKHAKPKPKPKPKAKPRPKAKAKARSAAKKSKKKATKKK